MSERPPNWPEGVEPISLEGLERLGINGRDELFWDGRRLITRRQIDFTGWQRVLAVLAALASIASIATGLNNAATYLCGRDIHWLGCPATTQGPK
ncbi:MAG: hypothetical protein JO326_09365 [Acetobacteraceae bacterium]|nr:hypothetical protein [Acetobacteraceae bacterium]